MADWQSYIDQVINKMDYNTNTYSIEGACTEAAIYGNDGSAWAWSPGFPELKIYQFPMEGMDGSITNVEVNEFATILAASQGKRTSGDVGGIRMGNVKFMFVTFDETTKTAQLSMPKGGAAVAAFNTGFVVAHYTKDKPMVPKGTQTSGQCADQVGAMAAFLTSQGY